MLILHVIIDCVITVHHSNNFQYKQTLAAKFPCKIIIFLTLRKSILFNVRHTVTTNTNKMSLWPLKSCDHIPRMKDLFYFVLNDLTRIAAISCLTWLVLVFLIVGLDLLSVQLYVCIYICMFPWHLNVCMYVYMYVFIVPFLYHSYICTNENIIRK